MKRKKSAKTSVHVYTYYNVFGKRITYIDEDTSKPVCLPYDIRLSTISLDYAKQFADKVYKEEKIVCEIYQVDRLQTLKPNLVQWERT